jgi:hypothetical protein
MSARGEAGSEDLRHPLGQPLRLHGGTYMILEASVDE